MNVNPANIMISMLRSSQPANHDDAGFASAQKRRRKISVVPPDSGRRYVRVHTLKSIRGTSGADMQTMLVRSVYLTCFIFRLGIHLRKDFCHVSDGLIRVNLQGHCHCRSIFCRRRAEEERKVTRPRQTEIAG